MNKIKAILLLCCICCANVAAAVTLTGSQVQWKTFNHTVNADYSLLNDTFKTDLVTHSYHSIILENEYVKATLVPEFGGRIISLIYKPTGHEQLYQNPVGRPYGPKWGSFYYNWLMVWGGIFPTLPEPEHGKSWCRPWEYEVLDNSPEKATVRMSFIDSIAFKKAPAKFKYGATNIVCTFEVSLAAQSSALKTTVTLTNPGNGAIPYEYWTNMGVAPGSAPGSTQCDDQTEIIGPVTNVKIGDAWPEIRKVEQNVRDSVYRFKNLRWYKNWTNDGIAYAWPVEGNFWGAINHANNEGIIRISENVKTPGLKIWGFGYSQSRGFNPETNLDYHRPFIELWAGASKEFFSPAQFPAHSTIRFDEYYTPVSGLAAITHASEHAVINLTADKASYDGAKDQKAVVSCKYFITKPAEQVTLSLQFKGPSSRVKIREATRTHDTNGPFELRDTIAVKNLCADINRLSFELRSTEQTLMTAEIPVSVSNAGTCVAAVRPNDPASHRITAAGDLKTTRRLYTFSGEYAGEIGKSGTSRFPTAGIYVVVDKKGTCARLLDVGRH